MEFTVAELFLLQSVIGDNIKQLANIKAENERSATQCVFSYQFVLNGTLIKAIDHRMQELNDLLARFGAEASSEQAAETELAAVDGEKVVSE